MRVNKSAGFALVVFTLAALPVGARAQDARTVEVTPYVAFGVDGRPQGAASSNAMTAVEIENLLARFLITREEYDKAFLNLVAEETKVVEVFDKSGRFEKRREIVSDLLVYQASRNSGARAEYRDARFVDGKALAKDGTHALELLVRASQATSVEKELSVINRESQRYDIANRSFSLHFAPGPTIQQGGAELQARQAFQVDWVGRDQIAGHDVVVLDYRQIAPAPGISLDVSGTGLSQPFLRGRLWLDATTSRLRRARFEVAGSHPAISEPVTVVRQESTYVEGRLGIHVPERIVFEFYERVNGPKKGAPNFVRTQRTTLSYGAFRQFEVSTDQTIRPPQVPSR